MYVAVQTVRLRVRQAAPLLLHPDLNIKVIALFRDPRAVRSSRASRGWCKFSACNSLTTLCEDHSADLAAATKLATAQPDRVMVAKYEELATKPKQAIPALLQVSKCICKSTVNYDLPLLVPWTSLASRPHQIYG